MKTKTTIELNKKIRDELKSLKRKIPVKYKRYNQVRYRNETYSELIERLLKKDGK